jgi:hypothetical protein
LRLGDPSAFGAGSGDKAKVQGMITTRAGDTIIVSSGGKKTGVLLTDQTVTKDDRGLFGLDKEHLSSAVLIQVSKSKSTEQLLKTAGSLQKRSPSMTTIWKQPR